MLTIFLIMFVRSLLRLRQELSKLIIKHTERITDPVARASNHGKLYDILLRGLSVSTYVMAFYILFLMQEPRRVALGRVRIQRPRRKLPIGGKEMKRLAGGWYLQIVGGER
jgi:hypothetical protein